MGRLETELDFGVRRRLHKRNREGNGVKGLLGESRLGGGGRVQKWLAVLFPVWLSVRIQSFHYLLRL